MPSSQGGAAKASPTKRPEPAALTANPLYQVGRLPSGTCREPAARPTSLAQVRAFYTAALACLDRTWAPVVQRAGYTFRPPKLVVSVGRAKAAPCNVAESYAFYCANGTIYIDASRDLRNYRDSDPSWTLASMAFLIAHEYGHHVQTLTGILAHLGERLSILSSIDPYHEELRRMELQASCLSGVFFGANRTWFRAGTSRLENWRWTVRNTGDDGSGRRDHGNKANHNRWSLAGLDSASPARCNTFTASSAEVS
ncbi:hypothetical protein FB561_4213 [Kribbella amoyensis]|uniref:Metalloprotease n=2 Tax=Kribbella amoyensis TaxID=996641 RepID=A0A561BW47_9ACTN|nr:hypothetical protein FB561_4213 [Kribbella amoyensis]